MARAQNPKRPHPDEPTPEIRQNKKIKRTEPRNYSPRFWDDLSKIELWPRALRELDRRNSNQPPPTPAIPDIFPTNLARFARHGGPDLDHLRGVTSAPDVPREEDDVLTD